MIPTPMKNETRKQFIQRCKSVGIEDKSLCAQTFVKEAKKTK
jgi:hypothetical protein